MNFWKNKKVLLTGHTGFKGSWLSLWLHRLGADVVGYSTQPPTQPSLFQVAEVDEVVSSVQGDVRDLQELKNVVKRHQPEIIIHMAAQALVRPSYRDPVDTYSTNVMGTVNLLESVRTEGMESVKVVLVITSDKCYENREWVWGYRENERMGGKDPYSNSKGCAELVTSCYRDSFFPVEEFDQHGIALASARAGNVIGGGDWAVDRLIPDMIKAIIRGEPVKIRSPKAIRPWQHVLEPLSGYMTLVERLWEDGASYSEGWNFGPDESSARNVAYIVEKLITLWGDDASWELDGANHVHEAHYLKLDCSKARDLLGVHPRLSLNDALTWVVDWYKSYVNQSDMRQKTLEQIERYQEIGRRVAQ